MRCVILDDYQDVALSMADWGRLGPMVAVRTETRPLSPEALVARLAGVQIVVAMRERSRFDAALLARLPDLKLLVTTGAANAAIDVAACARLGITLCGTGSEGHGAAELTWALLLALSRGIVAETRALEQGGWQHGVGRGLDGLRLGLLGLGRVGGRVARYGNAFGMRVSAWTPSLDAARAEAAGVVAAPSLDALFQNSDVISLHLPLVAETHGIVSAERLARMPPGGWLVNTARAGLIAPGALSAALRSGRLAGAALDVFATEPLPADDPLRELPNLLMTPHIGYVIDQTYRCYFSDALESIEAFLAGTPIRRILPDTISR